MEGKETTKIIKLFLGKGRVIPKKTGKTSFLETIGNQYQRLEKNSIQQKLNKKENPQKERKRAISKKKMPPQTETKTCKQGGSKYARKNHCREDQIKSCPFEKEKSGKWKIKELTENCQPIFLPIGTRSKGFGKPKATPVSGMEEANL